MKQMGIVKRVDELGRIVIPKEMREVLKIKDGEMLDIYLEGGDKIVLKKYSVMNNLKEFAQSFTDSIYEFFSHNIVITDKEKIIAFSGTLKEKYLNKDISEWLEDSIERRESILEKHNKDFYLINGVSEYGSYIIESIVCKRITVGLVIVFDVNQNLNEIDRKVAQIAAQFLSKYLES